MTQDQIKEILRRVETWPPERQEDAARVLLAMEAEGVDVFPLSPEDEEDLRIALEEVARGKVASQAEVDAFFARYRR